MVNIRQWIEPLAAWFRNLGLPEPITHWGHPVMMGIVIFVMGLYVAWAGWKIRINPENSQKERKDHRQLAPFMFLFIALGYTGGILSLVIQEQPIFESSHFWTGSIAVILLMFNGLISLSGFGGNKAAFRTVHAYLGSGAILLLIFHSFLGINLGISF